MALQSRPDLLQMQAAADKGRREETLAKTAYKPDFTVAAGYMLMPRGSEFRNNYMVEGSINLPWLNRRKHDAEIAESSAKVTEQDAEFDAMRNSRVRPNSRGTRRSARGAKASDRLPAIFTTPG